ncbi:hypothetical protein GIB67_001804 [Kingdonia uniflora]|uniref:Cytochrome P450 n=1 Tax=Kingdonia uniflora TaxID=39325 RepID=A0A7J7LBS4_9MAGN|nr:hypothetical protein GIB67_001804 [Kingdonia uniflora]
MLKSQEITGPPYKFLHGNTKEALNMIMGSLSKPMEHLSHDIMPKVQPHFHSWIKMYGRTVLSWHGSKPQLIITDPDLIKEVLNNKNGVYLKVKAEGFIRKLLGDGLVTSEGKKWAKQRKLANHAFHAENLKRMIPVMLTSLEMMLERWTRYEGNEIDVFEEFKITTSDAISRTAFGSSYLEGIKIFEDLTKLTALVAANSNRIRLPGSGKFVRTSDEIESDKLEHGIRESFIQIIRRREEKMKMEESNEYSCDYLGFLVKAYQDTDDNKKISIEDMIDECKTFYLAGHETVTSLVTWTVLLLAIHTDWQEKARMEVNELSVGNESTPDFNTIAKLKTVSFHA